MGKWFGANERVLRLRCAEKQYELSELAKRIKQKLGTEAELICEEVGEHTILLCMEEFYFRCDSYVSLSILLTEENAQQSAVIVGFGGGSGFLNISWGANQSFAQRGGCVLQELGFSPVE